MTIVQQQVARIALVGNPNTGKSTLFNALCGMRQRVGNYPGVTVEKKIGRCDVNGQSFQIIDLPGSYSLAPRSPDEMIAVEVLLGLRDDLDRPDAILCIVDASNLERNLYLVSQVLELNLPTVLALNMTDVAAEKGMAIDTARLAEQLQVPVVAIQAHRKSGLQELRQALVTALESRPRTSSNPFPPAFQQEVNQLEALSRDNGHGLPRFLVERLLLDTSGYLASSGRPGLAGPLTASVEAARERLKTAGMPIPAIEAMSRYQWVSQVTTGVVTRSDSQPITLTDRLDRVLTSRMGGTLVFLLVMLVMFEGVFYIGEYASGGIEFVIGALSGLVASHVAPGALQSLLVDGMLAGVGGVITFLPQIFVLFLFIAILEDCGYMARAAYLMDKVMSRVGLSGKSFIPLLSSFACAIPGIMSARVIENSRDRLLTILVAPLMSCSARFPVYVVLINAFIPDTRWLPGLPGLQALVLLGMYLLGIVTAVAVALLLRRTLFRGPTPPFVMELPAYKLPGWNVVLHRMFDSGWSFVRRAGTLILAVSILVWAAAYYPRDTAVVPADLLARQNQLETQLAHAADPTSPQNETAAEELGHVNNEVQGLLLRNSYLGRMGRWIEPVVHPLGWDWRIGCAVIASFPAREVVIATLGVIYNLGDELDEESADLRETLQNATWEGTSTRVFNVPVALSVMVFFALCAQCVSTLVVMRRETNSWRWPVFTFVYMTTLAYVGALLTYQIGMRLFS